MLFVILRTIGAHAPLALSLFQNSNFFLSQNNVIEIVLSCFLIFRIKETKDYVTSPRAWTCDFLPPSWSVSYGISLFDLRLFLLASALPSSSLLASPHRVLCSLFLARFFLLAFSGSKCLLLGHVCFWLYGRDICVRQNTSLAVQGPTQPSLLWYHPRDGGWLVSCITCFSS
jgi:hypothetical protein